MTVSIGRRASERACTIAGRTVAVQKHGLILANMRKKEQTQAAPNVRVAGLFVLMLGWRCRGRINANAP